MDLSDQDKARLDGSCGDAVALAMRILTRSAQVMGAQRLIDIENAHIDGCLYHGQASLDFVERLVQGDGKVVVPTTLNVGSLDLIHPELFRGGDELKSSAQRLMEAHIELGCESSFTCAPYQMKQRPRLGQQIAWAERLERWVLFRDAPVSASTLDREPCSQGSAPSGGLTLPD